jgi:uncharacterized DUF497 family protein
MSIDFDWDEAKSAINLRDRGLPFALARLLFDGPTLEAPDDRQDYGEVRIRAYGEIHGRAMACVFTDRAVSGRVVRRIISLRKANSLEAREYNEWLQNAESG